MSSAVTRRERIQREPRAVITDFDDQERVVIDACRKQFGSPVVVFGSRARGNWAEDSDIDVGVTGYDWRLHRAFAHNLSEFAGIKVDMTNAESALTHKGAVAV